MTPARVAPVLASVLALSLGSLSAAQTAPAPAPNPEVPSPPASGAAPAPAGSAAPAPSTPPSAPPAPPTPSAPAFVQPDTGTPVEFDSTKPLVMVYVAPGIVDTTPRYPDPFVKLGRTPFTVKLAPGTYTVNVESPEIPVGSTIVRVGAQPVHVKVKAGSDGIRGLGTLMLAAGAASALAGLVVELSYSPAPNGISKSKIAVPLFAIGGVGVAGGLTFYLLAGTSFEQDGLAPDRRALVWGVRSVW